MRLRGDVLSHENSVVYDTGLPGMDGYDSAPFFGTTFSTSSSPSFPPENSPLCFFSKPS